MRVRLLKPYRGRSVGAVWVPAWEGEARDLIRKGIAEPAVTSGSPAPITAPASTEPKPVNKPAKKTRKRK